MSAADVLQPLRGRDVIGSRQHGTPDEEDDRDSEDDGDDSPEASTAESPFDDWFKVPMRAGVLDEVGIGEVDSPVQEACGAL